MRILYILHSTSHAGSAISFLNMVQGVTELGVTALVVGPSPEEWFLNDLQSHRIEYKSVCIAECVYPSRESIKDKVLFIPRILNLFRRRKRSYQEIVKIASFFQPDIIHTNVGTIHEGLTVAKNIRVPHIWHIREYQARASVWSPFPTMNSLVRKFKESYIIAISRGLVPYYKLDGYKRATVIYNGIAYKSQKSLQWPRDRFFLCASRISAEKGINDVIKAFARFCRGKNDYRLVILGDGDDSYIQYLQSLATSLDCEKAICWEGFRPNVMDYMRKARGLIVASHLEGFGRMTAEASFAGCLVIGRNSTGTKEIIECTGGFLFDTVEDLFQGMVCLADLSEKEYMALAYKSQKRAVEAFSIEKNVDGVLGFYNHILKEQNNS